jgi:hypothetical protein
MILINAPIEPLENRYSKQWDSWFRTYFQEIFSNEGFGIKIHNVYGQTSGKVLDTIHFLDPLDTHIWKSSQMTGIIKLIQSSVQDGEKEFGVFFHDLWFPGIEQLKYVEDSLKISIKIFGIFHAGTWDKEDFTHQKGMYVWSKRFEMGWMQIADTIFVATEFHKSLILRFVKDIVKSDCDISYIEKKIKVTFLPVLESFDLRSNDLAHKKPWIAFPHRTVTEKGDHFLNKFENDINRLLPGLTIKKTHELTSSKKEFYELLSQCKWSVSLASQETFGISMIESLFSGCIPIVPDSLSYPEIFMHAFRYGGTGEYKAQKAVELMTQLDKMDIDLLTELLSVNKQKVKTKCEAAIPDICSHIISSMTRLK